MSSVWHIKIGQWILQSLVQEWNPVWEHKNLQIDISLYDYAGDYIPRVELNGEISSVEFCTRHNIYSLSFYSDTAVADAVGKRAASIGQWTTELGGYIELFDGTPGSYAVYFQCQPFNAEGSNSKAVVQLSNAALLLDGTVVDDAQLDNGEGCLYVDPATGSLKAKMKVGGVVTSYTFSPDP